MLESFELTHVRYEKGDNFGFLLALISLTPVFLVIMYLTLIVFRRDVPTLFAFIGQIFGLVINYILKKIFKIPRPISSELTDEGMPSNHSQFVAFFCIYYTIQIYSINKLNFVFKYVYMLFLIILCLLVPISR